MHTLFGAAGSGSAAVEAALGLCGLPFTLVRAAPTWHRGFVTLMQNIAQHPSLAAVFARHWKA